MKLNIEMVAGARYMDDVRIFLRGIRLGWRLIDDKLIYKEVWRREEIKAAMTSLEKTTTILEKVMNGICGWLVLTMENELMFNGTLPTLDLQLWVNKDNKVVYKYYEKPTTPATVIHARSAMTESTRRATLNQELIRRMTTTSELVEDVIRVEIVDGYAQKLINSEYNLTVTRNSITGGLKGYERLLSLSKDTNNPKWKPLHLSASWNSRNRLTAKLLAKTNWFKGRSEVDLPTNSNHQGGKKSGRTATKKRQRESSVSSQRDEYNVLADQEDDLDDASSNQKKESNHQGADETPRNPEESYSQEG